MTGPVFVEDPRPEEAALMDQIESYLTSMRWPTQEAHERRDGRRWGSSRSRTGHVSGRLNVGGAKRQAFVLGKARKWDDHVRLHESVHNRRHPELLALLRKLMRAHNPRFRFNAVQLNRNLQTKPHYDRRNVGTSYCLGLGDFRGGGLRLFASDGGDATDVDNRRRWVRYNGKETLHASVPVRSGVRFALIYYTQGLRLASSPSPRRRNRSK